MPQSYPPFDPVDIRAFLDGMVADPNAIARPGNTAAGSPAAAEPRHPPGTRALGPEGDVVELGADGQWRAVAGAQPAAVAQDGGMSDIAKMFMRPVTTLAAEMESGHGNLPSISDYLTGKFGTDVLKKAGRDAVVGVATLPRDIGDALNTGGQRDMQDRLSQLEADRQAFVSNMPDILARGVAQESLDAQLADMDNEITDIRQSLSANPVTEPQPLTIEKALPPQPTGNVAGDVTADLLRFIVPGVGAANMAAKATTGAPRALQALSQIAAAVTTDSTVAVPEQDQSVGDIFQAGPTQTATKDTNLGKRIAIGSEAGAASAVVESILAGLSKLAARSRAASAEAGPRPAGEAGTAAPPPDEPSPAAPGGAGPTEEDILNEALRRERARAEEEAARQSGNTGTKEEPPQPEQPKAQRKGPAGYSNTPQPAGPDGTFPIDDAGHVLSDKGGPIIFPDAVAAARWIVKVGNRSGGNQVFELSVHPSFDGKGSPRFSVRVASTMDETQPAAAARQAQDAPQSPREEAQFNAPQNGGGVADQTSPPVARVKPAPETVRAVEDTQPKPAVDKTPAGDQTVIPGAERASDKTMAERGMEGRMRPKAPQEAADDGLFDVSGRGQSDMLDDAPKATAKPPKPEAQPVDTTRAEAYAKKPGQPLTPQAMSKALDVSPNDARRMLDAMAARGKIRQTTSGRYLRVPKKGPLDLMQFLASEGGIKDAGGELAARDAQRFLPGYGALVRKGGMDLDEATRRAWEAGYFGTREDRPEIGELLDKLDSSLHGRRIFTEEDSAVVEARMAQARSDEFAGDIAEVEQELRDYVQRHGLDATDDEISSAAAAHVGSSSSVDPVDDLVDVLERNAMRMSEEDLSAAPRSGDPLDDAPFEDMKHANADEQAKTRAGGQAEDAGRGSAGDAGAEGGPSAPGEKPRGAGEGSGSGGGGAGGRGVGRDGTLSANPFGNPKLWREMAPEVVNAVVGGVYGNYLETGQIGISFKWALASAFATTLLTRLPVAGRTVLGKGSHAAEALRRTPDAMLKVPGGKYFHPRGGVHEDLWDKVQAMRTATRNWQIDAIRTAKQVREKFTAAERALMSDWIEQVDWPGGPAGGFRAADQRVRDMADNLSRFADDIGQRLVDLEMLDKDAYAALKGQYLHRYYDAHLAKEKTPFFAQKSTISGSWGRRRGETKMVAQPTGNRTPKTGDEIVEMRHAGSGKTRYVQAKEMRGNQTTVEYLEGNGWVRGKTWKVDALQGERMALWRDYTPIERRAMGEVRDAGYRFARGTMEASRDLALGQMFKGIAEDARFASKKAVPGWVRVPDTRVPGTALRKYGKLSGMWVDPQVMDAIAIVRKPWTNTSSEAVNGMMRTYLRVLGAWKVGKTAYNPATHFNNIMGNVTLSMLADDVNPADIARALKAMHRGDPIVEEARRAGLGLDVEVNIGDELQSLERELAALGTDPRGAWSKTVDALLHNKITKAYGAEDAAFKLASYMRARKSGMSEAEAVKHAHGLYFDYGDVPLGVQALRDFYAPFFTYTYKIAPVMARIAAEKPHRMVAAFGMLTGMSMMSYGLLYPDAPLGREQYERDLLPEWQKGRSAAGSERSIRLPWNTTDNVTGEDRALFLNSRYFLPGGDLLDMTNNSKYGPEIWPQVLGGTPLGGNPFVQTFIGAAFLGKDPYFGKDIYPHPDAGIFDSKAPTWQRVDNIAAMARWLSYQWMPPTATWSADKLGNAAVGEGMIDKDGGLAQFMDWTGTDWAGRQLSIERALLQIAGVKVSDMNPAEQERFRDFENRRRIGEDKRKLRASIFNQTRSEGEREDARHRLDDSIDRFHGDRAERDKLREAAGEK